MSKFLFPGKQRVFGNCENTARSVERHAFGSGIYDFPNFTNRRSESIQECVCGFCKWSVAIFAKIHFSRSIWNGGIKKIKSNIWRQTYRTVASEKIHYVSPSMLYDVSKGKSKAFFLPVQYQIIEYPFFFGDYQFNWTSAGQSVADKWSQTWSGP